MKRIYNYLIIIGLVSFLNLSCTESGESDIANPNTPDSGIGSSMASFSVVGNNLYIVNGTEMKTYDISQNDKPTLLRNVDFDRALETTFVSGNHLFVGSQSGMLIYDISNPEIPVLLSVYDHVTACDPVVVTGNIAYVTIRDGNGCGWGNNLLDIIDISNKSNPVQLNSLQMDNPHGLAVDGNLLFVCEGTFGLKVFDITQRDQPILLEQISGITTYDVLAISGKLIITGTDLFMIYDYTDLNDIKFLYTLNYN